MSSDSGDIFSSPNRKGLECTHEQTRLILERHLSLSLKKVDSPLATGWNNAIQILTATTGETFALKICLPSVWPAGKMSCEATGLRLAREAGIKVPKVFAVDTTLADCPFFYLLMEAVEGTQLNSRWKHYNDESKVKIFTQIIEMIAKLRCFSFDTLGAVQTIDGRVVVSELFDFCIGPFASELDYLDSFLEHFIDKANRFPIAAEVLGPCHFSMRLALRKIREASSAHPRATVSSATSAATEVSASSLYKPSCDFVLTHGDIAGRNILVQGDEIVAFVDWEWARALPARYEFVDNFMDDIAQTAQEKALWESVAASQTPPFLTEKTAPSAKECAALVKCIYECCPWNLETMTPDEQRTRVLESAAIIDAYLAQSIVESPPSAG